MKITYTFNSSNMCESALITHAHASETRLRATFPGAEVSVLHGADEVYSLQCDDLKTQVAVAALMERTARYTFDYAPLLTMMGQLHGYNK